MNTEEITQVVEAIKTLNLNVDSQTMVQIIEKIKPILLWAYVIDPLIGKILGFTFFMVIMVMVHKFFRWWVATDHIEKCNKDSKECKICEKWDN